MLPWPWMMWCLAARETIDWETRACGKEACRDRYTGRPVWLLLEGPVIDISVGVSEEDVTVEVIIGQISHLE